MIAQSPLGIGNFFELRVEYEVLVYCSVEKKGRRGDDGRVADVVLREVTGRMAMR